MTPLRLAPAPASKAALLSALLGLSAALPAQKDLRDEVRLKNGQTIAGRIYNPHDPDSLTVRIGGKRERFSRTQVAATTSVQQNLAELLDRRRQHPDNTRLRWILAEWAQSRELPEMAQLLALELVLEDPDHTAAHEMLGHRRSARGWLWQHDGQWLTRDQLELTILDWNDALHLESEHWRLVFDAGLLEGVRALFDLEHLYQYWHETFGAELQLHEALGQKMEVRVRRNDSDFPRWGQEPKPYFTPDPFGDVAETFYPALQPTRPAGLFFVGTQHILYHCLMADQRVRGPRDRICAWLEVGLGRYADQVMRGDAGQAVGVRPAKLDPVDAANALAWPGSIENLIHVPMYAGFYMRGEYVTDTNWGAASSLTAFLMDHPDADVQKRFRAYVRAALAGGAGDSSRAFDEAMEQKIETFQQPWRAAAVKAAGLGG